MLLTQVVHPQNWCFDNERPVLEETIRHDVEQIGKYKRIIDQYEFRKETILEVLHSHGINISKLNAVCGRGGLLRPIEGGTYTVNDAMLEDLKMDLAVITLQTLEAF